MLVWLAEHLVKYYSGFNVFSYLTFRAIVSLLTALFISLWMGPRMIAHLQKLSFGQVVRNDGPESHFQQARYADHGRDYDPDGDCDLRTAVGLPVQSVRLVRVGGAGRLRCYWLC